jgi:hypothetical protein
LIAIVSEADEPRVASSAYIDRRGVGEVVAESVRAPALEALAAERERERDGARAAYAEAGERAAERERERDAARAALAECERERDAARAAQVEAEQRAAAAHAALIEAEKRDAARWMKRLRVKTRPYRRAIFSGFLSRSKE